MVDAVRPPSAAEGGQLYADGSRVQISQYDLCENEAEGVIDIIATSAEISGY
jgi:hypothetical protein